MKRIIAIITIVIVSFALYSCNYADKESFRWIRSEVSKMDNLPKSLENIKEEEKKEIVSAAQKGDAEAIYQLAALTQDNEKSMELIHKSAELGYVPAIIHEAVESFNDKEKLAGTYIPKLKKLANEGNLAAQKYLAFNYESGFDGGIPNEQEAVKWGRMAAEQGDAEAQYALGVSYEKGIGVEKDVEEALEWYVKSAKQEYVKAGVQIIRLVLVALEARGDIDKDNLDDDTVTNLRKWINENSEDIDVKYLMAECFERGLLGFNRDLVKAKQLYREVADTKRNWENEAVVKSAESALERLEPLSREELALKKAKNGNLDEVLKIADEYREKNNYVEAEKWLLIAAEQGNAYAQWSLGCNYLLQKKIDESVKWHFKAANQGYPKSQYVIGNYYLAGIGLPQNTGEAIRWLSLAAQGDDKEVAAAAIITLRLIMAT